MPADFWPHGKVAQEYGLFNDDAGCALRRHVLADKSGEVAFAEINDPIRLGAAREQGSWRKAVAALAAGFRGAGRVPGVSGA
ncbi:MAG: hypothetical protein ACRDRH_22095 [Pseudonocardia sp.]